MTTASPARLHIVVAYATAQQEILREVWMEQGATLGAAIEQSGILAQIVESGSAAFDPAVHPAGIFGKKKPPETLLRDGDRIELYRPLVADPKESRRRRASGKPAAS